jgi:hypothetical protein
VSQSPTIRFEELSHAQFLSLASDGEDGLIARIEERAAQRAECKRNTFVVTNQQSQTRREEYDQVLGLRCPTHKAPSIPRRNQRHILVICNGDGQRVIVKGQYSLLELATPPTRAHEAPKSGTRATTRGAKNRRARAA